MVNIPKRKGPRQDDGFFGPESLMWEVIGHPVTAIGLTRGTFYTALSSEVTQAVHDHSKFFTDTVGRAQETAYWLFASAFGDRQEATRAGKWVQGRHAKVKGHDPVTDKQYSAGRPDLAIAGHGLIWDGFRVVYETFVRPFTPAERDRFWQESLIVAELMGIDPAIIPPTPQDWHSCYKAEIQPGLCYSTVAAEQVEFTKWGRFAPVPARPAAVVGFRLLLEMTLATLGPIECATLGEPRSELRIAATRRLGREFWRAATLPPVRDQLERAYGTHVHELLCEARVIKAGLRDRSAEWRSEPAWTDVAAW